MKVFYTLKLKITLSQMKHLKTQMKKNEVKMQISKTQMMIKKKKPQSRIASKMLPWYQYLQDIHDEIHQIFPLPLNN